MDGVVYQVMRRRLIVLFFALILVGLGLLGDRRVSRLHAAAGSVQPLSPDDDVKIGEQRQKQCVKCHVLPPPEYVPRGMWRFRIREMAERSMMGTGVPPGEESLLWQLDLDKLTTWYETRAPEVLPLPDTWPGDDGGLRFMKHTYNPPGAVPVPVVAYVRFFDLDGDGKPEIVACDMGRGSVFVGDPARSPGVLTQIAVSLNPDHAEMVDLDKDGKQDLLVADLGEFLPADHEKGSVVWLRQTTPLQFEKRVLIENIPRSADAQAADFDGDGDLDLVVAAFGWHRNPSSTCIRSTRVPGRSMCRLLISIKTGGWISWASLLNNTSTWSPISVEDRAEGSGRRRFFAVHRPSSAHPGSRSWIWTVMATPTCFTRTATRSTISRYDLFTVSAGWRTRKSYLSFNTTLRRCRACTARKRRTWTATATSISWPAPFCPPRSIRFSKTSSARATWAI
jgi:hypothetical protein